MLLENIKSALFVGAHTDDEMICSGTLARLVGHGANVHIISFSFARIDGMPEAQSKEILKKEFAAAMDILGIPEANRWLPDFETRELPENRSAVRQYVYDFVTRVRPDAAFLLSPYDEHQDHQTVGEECERAAKGRVPLIVRCQYPWNYRSFNPNLYISLTDKEFQVKLAHIKAYRSQAFRYDYEKLFGSYAVGDGVSVRRQIAEKFEIVRCVA
ncbi:MAG: PIG-L family deacetylase [bacterium]|nr:PIG-L family deacetylase [bacterium]